MVDAALYVLLAGSEIAMDEAVGAEVPIKT
jgi:hypothetical protein